MAAPVRPFREIGGSQSTNGCDERVVLTDAVHHPQRSDRAHPLVVRLKHGAALGENVGVRRHPHDQLAERRRLRQVQNVADMQRVKSSRPLGP